MQRITVTRFSDGVVYTGTVESSDKAPGPDGKPVDRLVVVRDDNGTKEYVLPGITGHVAHGEPSSDSGQAVAGLEHLAPPPGMPIPPPGVQVVGSAPAPSSHAPAPSSRLGAAPPTGSSIGGTAIPAVPPQIAVAPAQVTPPPSPEPERRFMVQSRSGRTSVYHTISDCPRASGDLPTLLVDDQAIEFFDLTLCTSCAKLADQVSWREVMEQVLSSGGADPRLAERIASEFEALGFTVRPNRVERPADADDKDR